MPTYDYKCLDCAKESVVFLSLKDRENGAAKCPACGSKNMVQQFTEFMAQTGKKS